MEKDSRHSNSAREQKAYGIQNLEVNKESKAVAKRKISYRFYFSFIATLGMNSNHLYL